MVIEKLTCNVLVSLQAKKILSRKQALSKTLDKKESLLLNSQDIIQRIQDAHSDANVSNWICLARQIKIDCWLTKTNPNICSL